MKKIEKLANQIVNYSCDVQEGEKIYIQAMGLKSKPLIDALINEIYKVKAIPFYDLNDEELLVHKLNHCSQEQLEIEYSAKIPMFSQMDKYIKIGAIDNGAILQTLAKDKLMTFLKFENQLTQIRLKKPYLIMKFIGDDLVQKSKLKKETFENFYYDVVLADYPNMSIAMNKLKSTLEKTNQVRINNQKTDITFSVQNIPVIACDGKYNLPDGEVFTAPVKESVNGFITYNTPSYYRGEVFNNVHFKVKNGKIIEASSDNTDKLNEILDIDEGARYFGEFAFGVNTMIKEPMMDILYDEKIAGSIHLTPGTAYPMANNGNQSKIHWDLILRLSKENGGGEVYFDDQLVYKDGCFLDADLKILNPINRN